MRPLAIILLALTALLFIALALAALMAAPVTP
jgi:hypothetical protein